MTKEELQRQIMSFDEQETGCISVLDYVSIVLQFGIPLNQKMLTFILASIQQTPIGAISIDIDELYSSLADQLGLKGTAQEARQEMEIMEALWDVIAVDQPTVSTETITRWIQQTKSKGFAQKLLLAMADTNEDGMIDFDEFARTLRRIQNCMEPSQDN